MISSQTLVRRVWAFGTASDCDAVRRKEVGDDADNQELLLRGDGDQEGERSPSASTAHMRDDLFRIKGGGVCAVVPPAGACGSTWPKTLEAAVCECSSPLSMLTKC